MDVCQFPLAAYYGKVARARMVKFSHKIRPVQPFVVLNFRGCATNGVHVRGPVVYLRDRYTTRGRHCLIAMPWGQNRNL